MTVQNGGAAERESQTNTAQAATGLHWQYQDCMALQSRLQSTQRRSMMKGTKMKSDRRTMKTPGLRGAVIRPRLRLPTLSFKIPCNEDRVLAIMPASFSKPVNGPFSDCELSCSLFAALPSFRLHHHETFLSQFSHTTAKGLSLFLRSSNEHQVCTIIVAFGALEKF